MGLEAALSNQDWEQPLSPSLSMEPGNVPMGSLQSSELVQRGWQPEDTRHRKIL
jgi:hypothetical protein